MTQDTNPPVTPLVEAKPVREGDDILHKPSGETWCVASVYPNGNILCAGWPCSLAKPGEFELVRACSDEEHAEMLRRCAEAHCDDERVSLAKEKLRPSTALSTPRPDLLGELLDVIFRDGGNTRASIGDDAKAVAKAIEIVVGMVNERDDPMADANVAYNTYDLATDILKSIPGNIPCTSTYLTPIMEKLAPILALIPKNKVEITIEQTPAVEPKPKPDVTAQAEKLMRYAHTEFGYMLESPDGHWVKHADVLPLLAERVHASNNAKFYAKQACELELERDALRKRVEELTDELTGATQREDSFRAAFENAEKRVEEIEKALRRVRYEPMGYAGERVVFQCAVCKSQLEKTMTKTEWLSLGDAQIERLVVPQFILEALSASGNENGVSPSPGGA